MQKVKFKQNNEGSALIAVLCVICVFMALIMALILTSYQVLAHAQKAATKEQCRIGTLAFDKAFRAEMTQAGANTVAAKLGEQIKSGTWTYYNEYEEGHEKKSSKSLEVDLQEQNMTFRYGQFAMKAYWTGSETDVIAGDYSNITLVVKTTCALRKQSFTLTTTYVPMLSTGGTWDDESTWLWTVM